MKKIGIDARLLTKTGVGVYTKNLLFYSEKLLPKDWFLYVYLQKGDYNAIKFSNKNIIKKTSNYLWHSFDEQLSFASQLLRDNLDLMHFTYFSYPVRYKKPFAITIHDLTHLEHHTGKASTKNSLHYFIKRQGLRIVLQQAIKKSVSVITPTHAVKNQIIKRYGTGVASKITVISEGVNHELMQANENKELINKFGSDFFLYVGNFYPHKNVEKLIEAFSHTPPREKLILAGPEDVFAKRLQAFIVGKKLDEKVIIYRNPHLADLVFFYKRAKVLVHPSLNEGFCLPLLEAAYFHLPVVASDIPVFKEVLGEEYRAFNPQDTSDIQKALNEVIKKKPEFNYQKILAPYSFKKMAEETLVVYKKVLEAAQ